MAVTKSRSPVRPASPSPNSAAWLVVRAQCYPPAEPFPPTTIIAAKNFLFRRSAVPAIQRCSEFPQAHIERDREAAPSRTVPPDAVSRAFLSGSCRNPIPVGSAAARLQWLWKRRLFSRPHFLLPPDGPPAKFPRKHWS